MASDISEDAVGSRRSLRESRLEGLGACSLAFGIVAAVGFFVPGLAELAWVPAAPAIVLGFLDLGLQVDRRRYAIAGAGLGVIAFSWSIAMVMFGSAR